MSNEEAIRVFVFTSDLVIRQQVSELLNEADNLRNIIQRNTVLFDKVCLQQTFQHFLVLSWFAEFFYLSLIQCYSHRKLQRNRNPFPSRLINGEIICHSNFCICGQNLEWCTYSNIIFYFGSYQHSLRTQTREATTRNTSAFAGSIISSERIY